MGTAAIVGGSAILGGVLGAKGAKDAAKIQSRAADRGIDVQQQALESFEERTDPFRQIGLGAADEFQNFLADPSAGLDDIAPIVSFLRDEGFEQIQESAAARGRLGAGGTLEDLARFNLDLSSTVVPQLRQQRFNELFSTVGLGANVATGQGTAGLNTAGNITNLLGAQGAAQAGGKQGVTSAMQGALQNLSGVAGAFPNLFGGGDASVPATSAFGGPSPLQSFSASMSPPTTPTF